MRPINYAIASAGSMAADITSAPIPVDMMTNGSIHAAWTGSCVGTMFIEANNDASFTIPWSPVPASQISINSDGTVIYGLSDIGYAFIRLRYARVSGSGTLNARVHGRIEQ